MTEGPCVVAFTGPSLEREELGALLPDADARAPVGRYDLYEAREQGAAILFVVDGVFGHQFAVSPREVVDVANDGAFVLGASSMGAIRAAECWPAGVHGSGLIYRMYRSGFLQSDDEVAVATDPEESYRATSVALVNVRSGVFRAIRAGLIERTVGRRLVDAAQRLYFAERTWPRIFGDAGADEEDRPELRTFLEGVDVKREDAVRAARRLAALMHERPELRHAVRRPGADTFQRGPRYTGHDRLLGLGRPPAVELTQWLFGSGRYQPYVWGLVAGEPEVARVATRPDERPEALRDALVLVFSRVLDRPDDFAERVWHELDFLDELDAELLRWHAATTMASRARRQGGRVPSGVLQRAREEVAIAHGCRDWRMVLEEVVDGRLFGAIPFSWVAGACELMAEARFAAGAGGLKLP